MGGEAPRNASSTSTSNFCRSLALSCRSSTSRPSPEQDVDLGLALLQEREVPARQVEHRRIELVVAHRVAFSPERRDHARAQSDDADAQRCLRPACAAFGVVGEGVAEPAAQIEAANGLHAALGVLELPALVDAGLKHAERVFLRLVLDTAARSSPRHRNCGCARPGVLPAISSPQTLWRGRPERRDLRCTGRRDPDQPRSLPRGHMCHKREPGDGRQHQRDARNSP